MRIRGNLRWMLLVFLSISLSEIYSQSNLESLIQKAISVSPEIKMLEAKWETAKNRIPQNSNLPDPTLTFGIANLPINSFSFSQEPMTGKFLALSQGIPFPGKLESSEKVASIDPKIVELEIAETKLQLRRKVSKVYYNLSYLRTEIKYVTEIKALLKSISEVVQQKYSVSEASQQNVFQIELSLSKFRDKISDLRSKEKVELGKLNVLLNQNSSDSIYTSSLARTNKLKESTSFYLELAKSNNPSLQKTNLLVEKARLMQKLSEFEFYPDFKFSLQSTQRDQLNSGTNPQNDFLSASIGLSIPIDYGGKKTSKIEETISLRDYYQRSYDSGLQLLEIDINEKVEVLNNQTDREKIINEGMLQQATQNFNSSLSSYQVGKIDFINVIEAVNSLLEVRISENKIRRQYYLTLTDLQYLIGADEAIQINFEKESKNEIK